MHRALPLFCVLAFFLPGCLKLDMRVLVKKNGSGSYVETVQFDSQIFSDFLGRLPGKLKEPWNINKEELKAGAAKKGKGVKLVSAEPVTDKNWKGYRATYSFSDVRHLIIDPNPGEHAPKTPGQPPPQKKGDPMRFQFKKGGTPKLTVVLPRDESQKGSSKKVDPSDPGFDMMRGMLKDMSVRITVELDGKVVASNASHRSGSQLTLLDLNFNRLIGDSEKLQQVFNAEGYQDAAAAFNSVKGIKIEDKKKVYASFK